jgi:glycerol-1-phosphate dehydrogenase [NAD(P)+]
VSRHSHPFLDEVKARFGGDRCGCGKVHRLAPVEVIFGEGALESSARDLLQRYGGGASLWVLSDEHTEAAAGERWKRAVRAGNIASRILPGDPAPTPTLELAQALSAEVRALAPDLLVGVGSGVVSDLVKKVSLDTGVPNGCIATAASVDAHASATAAIRVAGHHRTLPARPSEMIVCDLEVLARAPRRLFLAGLGDLLAKYLASLDWRLGACVADETFCDVVAGFALGSARGALDAARTFARNQVAALSALMEAALVSGFAMQAFGSSRPAASAEHSVAHFWEAAGAVEAKEHALHGIQVGAATKLLLPGYAAFFGPSGDLARLGEPDLERRLLELGREPLWEAALEEGMTPYRLVIAEEQGKKVHDPSILRQRLQAFTRKKEHILAFAAPLLDELGAAVETLEGFGFPFSLETLRMAKTQRLLPVRNVRLLRNRYSAFDLAHELGLEGELLASIAAGA